MKILYYVFTALLFIQSNSTIGQSKDFRPPALPLITHDPYFSIWSANENPTKSETVHWTQKAMPIHCIVRIDGSNYRLMGTLTGFVPAANFVKSRISATITSFIFKQDSLEIEMSFLSPVLAEDIDLASRPVTYLTWKFKSTDNKKHDVEIYFDISGLASVDNKGQSVIWSQKNLDNLEVLKIGSKDQQVLEKEGDDLRIDWGYLNLAASVSAIKSKFMGRGEDAITAFAENRSFPETDYSLTGKNYDQIKPVLALTLPLSVNPEMPDEKHIFDCI